MLGCIHLCPCTYLFKVNSLLCCLLFPHRDFSWSPKENRIVYWVPETSHIPAKIIIVEIPSRNEISTKSRHLVSDVRNWCRVFVKLNEQGQITDVEENVCSVRIVLWGL